MTNGRTTSRWTVAAMVVLWIAGAGASTAVAGEDEQGEDTVEGVGDEVEEQELVDEERPEGEVEADEEAGVEESGPDEASGLDAPQLPDVDLEAPEDADPELEAQLEAYRESYERYATTIDQYQRAIENLVQTEYERREAEINAAYDPQIREALAVESHQRREAVESLEQFLEQFPNDPDYTPDAVFRLAILYDRLEDEQYRQELGEWRQARQDPDLDPDEMPETPERHYDDSRQMFERIVNDWPDYRGIDYAYYFLFNLEWAEGNYSDARALAQRLVNEVPDSRFLAEAHLLIGEYYFEQAEAEGRDNIRERLKLARDGYLKASTEEARRQMTDTKFVQAVYSLAWSHYRLEHFPEALGAFRDTVEVIDEFARLTGNERQTLRDDSLGHMAYILTMDWDLAADDVAGYTIMERVETYLSEGHPYEREVLGLLGEELMELTRYDDAIAVYEHILDQDPMHPDNPKIHRRIVAALVRNHQNEEAVAVRRQLVDYYGEGSAWHQHQQRMGNEAAIREMEGIVRDYLLAAATAYHEQAQNTRNEAAVRQDAAMHQQAVELYEQAAESYYEFLQQFPNDPEIFQWNYQYADALYNARRFQEAFEQYQVVRELDIPDNPFQEHSARRAVQSIEAAVQAKIERGELVTPLTMEEDTAAAAEEAAETVEERREFDDDAELEQITVEGEEIPPIVMDWVTAMDRYVVLGLEADEQEQAGALYAFHAADVFHDYEHFDESRRRFEWIVNQYPEHEVGYIAGLRILESFRIENDFEGLAEWAENLEGVIEGEQAEAIREEVREYRLRASFQAAADMEEEGRYEAAAEQYAFLAREAPDHEQAPLALHNAARMYLQVDDRESAIEQYETLFREYPDHELSIRAVYRVADLSQQLFHYEKSVRHYELFYDEYRGPTPSLLQGLDFDIEERRETALFRAAHMHMYLQNYEEAAETAEDFFATYPDMDAAPDLLWQASEAWDEAGQPQQMTRVLDQYVSEFQDEPDHVERIFEAYRRTADLYAERGDEQAKFRQFEMIVDEYEAMWGEVEERGPGGVRDIVAEAHFHLIEREFEEWDQIDITGGVQQQQRLLQERLEGMGELVQKYREVTEYGRLDWILAGFFRMGNTFHRTADAMLMAEPPFEEGSMEYWDYRDAVDQQAFPLQDRAIEFYENVVEQARANKVVNEWSERAWEALNEQQEDVYPMYESGTVPTSETTHQSLPTMTYEQYQRRLEREDADRDGVTDDIEADVEDRGEPAEEIDPDVDSGEDEQ